MVFNVYLSVVKLNLAFTRQKKKKKKYLYQIFHFNVRPLQKRIKFRKLVTELIENVNFAIF